ncbi:MAG: PorT family protein [Lewinellaceae bacterium]|nr:PorT family protein [Saprospiraceae bacterium]MCB9340291.1 PorT family protein [Lewinellaceae bacterium]
MKKSLVLSFVLVLFSLSAFSQVKFGIKAGFSTDQLDRETVSAQGLSIAIKDANYGVHFGLMLKGFVSDHFYLQPEALLNSNSVDYTVNDVSDGLFNKALKERYQNLDLPFMIGYQLGPLHLETGPVGHLHIASQTELDEVGGYSQKFSNFTLGYQAGAGLDIWKLTVGVRYEGNFTKAADHMRIGNEEIRFSQNPSRWVFSAGFYF